MAFLLFRKPDTSVVIHAAISPDVENEFAKQRIIDTAQAKDNVVKIVLDEEITQGDIWNYTLDGSDNVVYTETARNA